MIKALLIIITIFSTTMHTADIIPPALQPGDTIAFISPAYFPHVDVAQYKQTLEAIFKEYKIIFGKHAFDRFGYFAGTDEERLDDVHTMFANEDVKAIIANRGGWGCNRIIDRVDYDLIRENPKILMGYSDLTGLINAIYAQTGLVTYHGPMGISTWINHEMQFFEDALVKGKKSTLSNVDNVTITTYKPGKARGKLMGGNLSVFTAMLGSPYLIQPELISGQYILFLEEVEEAPYRIDRMMTSLHLAGWLEHSAGIVFGRCTACTTTDPDSFTYEEVLQQKFKGLTMPIFSGAMFGHIDDQYILPVGLEVEIDATQGTIQYLSPAVNLNNTTLF